MPTVIQQATIFAPAIPTVAGQSTDSETGLRLLLQEGRSDEMRKTNGYTEPSDALVLFGITGDLAYKKIFPALYAMIKKGMLDVPLVGVASTPWSIDQIRERATQSISDSGEIDDKQALDRLLSLLRYSRSIRDGTGRDSGRQQKDNDPQEVNRCSG